jgi:predicted alpha/beta superfamily hydrolase
MLRRGLALVVVLTGWVGCSSAGSGLPPLPPDAHPHADAAPGQPDAADQPDAAPGQPDAAAGQPDAAPGQPDAAPITNGARVIVHYPLGTGHKMTVRGNGAGLNWNTGMNATMGANDEWTIDLPVTAAIELKPLIDDATWSIGPNYGLVPGQTLDIWPHFTNTAGRMENIANFHSATLNNSRNIEVYLPPSYDENPDERFPVIYMHDGQNLWNDADAAFGVSWRVGQAMDNGAMDASIHEAIIVGIDNNADRIPEYTPVPDPTDGGGNADNYLKFIITELKPQIDTKYRTYPDKEHTGMIGSSLGGLLSAYTGVSHPDVFGMIGAMSPSTWWDNFWIINEVTGANNLSGRMYLDSGDSGTSNDDVTYTAMLDMVYQQKPVTLDYLVQAGGQHSEYYWAQRVPGALGFLLGGR